MNTIMQFDTQNIQHFTTPFHFLKSENFLDKDQAQCILEWFDKNDDLWHLTKADFYTQYEFSLSSVNVPASLEFITSQSTLASLRQLMEQYYQCQFKDMVDIVAHKLTCGHKINIHNDYLDEKEIDFSPETHRLLIQINSGWDEENGGFLMLFNSENTSDINDIILPQNASMFSFEISKNSYHAVSRINQGFRYTLIYNFYKSK